MGSPTISSLSNPLVKRARALRQRKAREETGLFLVEGLHPVGEAIEAGWEFEALLYSPDLLTSSFGERLVAENSAKLQPVTAEVMQSMADKENPQGILGILHQRQSRPEELALARHLVAMVTPQDPGNVGTVLRTMDAVGADGMFLVDGGVDPYNPTCVRASMGAIFWKLLVQLPFPALVEWSHTHGIQLIGTSAHTSTDYAAFEPRVPWMLVLGSEQKGLAQDQLENCDSRIALPMRGRASSLNVAVAAGVLLYALTAKD